MSIVTVALPIAVDQPFDYWVPAGLDPAIGSIVRVPIGRRTAAGVVIARPASSEVPPDKLRPVVELLAGVPPIPDDVMRLAVFAARYYHQAVGPMLASALPAALLTRRSRPGKIADRRRGAAPAAASEEAAAPAAARAAPPATGGAAGAGQDDGAPPTPALNPAQDALAVAVIGALGRYEVFLLRGVTGSGKTEVYLAAARQAIAQGGQVLLLVPEINLTPQLAARVGAALPGVEMAVMHSGLTGRARAEAWRAAAEGRAGIVLGTRLAVFAPLPRLAMVVVDEEHDPSFRQDDGVRYHARDLAVVRARQRAVPVVLASATPSLESWWQAQRGRYRALALGSRASPDARPPALRRVPNRGHGDSQPLSPAVLAAIEARLARGEQSLVFVNRRGFAPSLLCHSCGWAASCDRCSARLVLHKDARELRCHHCGHARPVVVACPGCGNQDLFPVGAGTQRLEQELARRFPQARIARVDRDSTARREAFPAIVARILAGEVDILVGTQMLAKGHDFPRLTLVAVLGADNALYSADFRATERLYALLLQVAGRAGRRALPGEVIVQTDFPEHPVHVALEADDFPAFARTLLAERRDSALPPFAHLALLAAQAHGREEVDRFLAAAHTQAAALVGELGVDCDCHPPGAPALARRAGFERGQLLLQSRRRSALHALLRAWRPRLVELAGRRVRWQLDVDPLELG